MKRLIPLVIAILAISCTKAAPPEDYSVLGSDPVGITAHETAAEAMKELKKADARGAPLVVLASHDIDLPAFLKTVSGTMGRGVSRVYWALPGLVLEGFMNAEPRMREYLALHLGLVQKDIDALVYSNACLDGEIAGMSISLCNLINLPSQREGILLFIDPGFFVQYADARETSKLAAIHATFSAIFPRKFRVAGAFMSYGVEDGLTRPIHRYLGEVAVRVVDSPSLLLTPPLQLWSARDNAESLFVAGQYDVLSRHIGESLGKHPDDPAIVLINAASMVRLGGYEEALMVAESLCASDPGYCAGLQYLGYLADLKGEDRWAGVFDKRAQELGRGKLPERLYYAAPARAGQGDRGK